MTVLLRRGESSDHLYGTPRCVVARMAKNNMNRAMEHLSK